MNTSYMRLTLADREHISQGIYAGETFAQIARKLRRPPSTVCNEVWRSAGYRRCYCAKKAQTRADAHKKKGRLKKLDANPRLRDYVHERLRREWSPEEIAMRLKKEYPQDMAMRVSSETIYQHLYCLPKGELKKELMHGLRRERKRRLSRSALHYRRQRIQDIISISERPREVRGRIIPGHWEG